MGTKPLLAAAGGREAEGGNEREQPEPKACARPAAGPVA